VIDGMPQFVFMSENDQGGIITLGRSGWIHGPAMKKNIRHIRIAVFFMAYSFYPWLLCFFSLMESIIGWKDAIFKPFEISCPILGIDRSKMDTSF
jgi:hypothetical protein